MLVVIIIIAIVVALAGGYFYYTRYMNKGDEEEIEVEVEAFRGRRRERLDKGNLLPDSLAITRAARREARRAKRQKTRPDAFKFKIASKKGQEYSKIREFCERNSAKCIAIIGISDSKYVRVFLPKDKDINANRSDFERWLTKYKNKNPNANVVYNVYEGLPLPKSL